MNTQIAELLQKKWAVPAITGVVSFAGGLTAGYIWGKRNGDVFEISQEALDEINDVGEIKDTDDVTTFDLDDVELHSISLNTANNGPGSIVSVAGVSTETVEVADDTEVEEIYGFSAPAVVSNVFEGNDEDWDWEAEKAKRTSVEPYILHRDEFMENEMDLRQETLTYYQGDDIVADQADTPIYGYHHILGELKFGHGSKDSNVVYIRNESMALEWEVLLHSGRYEVEVNGLELEQEYAEQDLKHARVMRFRDA